MAGVEFKIDFAFVSSAEFESPQPEKQNTNASNKIPTNTFFIKKTSFNLCKVIILNI